MYLPVLIPMVLVSNGLAQNSAFLWPMIFVNVGSWCVPTRHLNIFDPALACPALLYSQLIKE